MSRWPLGSLERWSNGTLTVMQVSLLSLQRWAPSLSRVFSRLPALEFEALFGGVAAVRNNNAATADKADAKRNRGEEGMGGPCQMKVPSCNHGLSLQCNMLVLVTEIGEAGDRG